MRAARSRRWASATYVTACVAFAGTIGVLAGQVRAGADPALGPVASSAPSPRPRVVVTRKIIRTTVITKRVIRRPAPVAMAPASPPASGGFSAAPNAIAAAPAGAGVPSAPAASPPPPPAPAAPPAPVTRGS